MDNLPVEMIISIFQYLDEKSLCRISRVCKLFNQLASSNCLWRKWKNKCIIVSNYNGLQSSVQPHFKEQCRLSMRWCLGRCKLKNALKFKKHYLPWLKLNQDLTEMFLAVGDSVTKYKRKCWMKRNSFHDPDSSLFSQSLVHRSLDVVRFNINESHIITGGWHGTLSIAAVEDLNFYVHEKAHASDVSDVAFCEDFVVSGSRDQSFKVWKLHEESPHGLELRYSEIVRDDVLSIATNKVKRLVAVGTGGVGGVHPLQIKDLESGRHVVSLGDSFKHGAGVLDSHFQTADLLMTTGYDTYVRLWDMRASNRSCVRSWEEPHDNTVYCVASDNCHGFVSGSCRHGVTRLWDVRMKNCVQTFYLGGKVSSPVYTVGLTHSHLFAGLARGLFVLDFR